MSDRAASTPAPLPISLRRAEIQHAISAHQVVVISGATGSGKTTQLPQFCLDLGLAATGKGCIGHTQPRRLAARAVAARIANELGVPLGGLVGAKVRFDDRTSRQTRIKVMTDGVLLAELAGDPALSAYSTLIIDEAHERSLNIDLLLGCLRRLLPRRPDLKLIITSATIDTARFSDAFGGPARAPIIEVSGRLYPVEIRYRPPAGARDAAGEHVDPQAVADAVDELLRPSDPRDDVLVFLPGEREIAACSALLQRRAPAAEILPLLSRLSADEQDRIFRPGPRPRVILATNIAETSLTVPRIRSVVDTGLARLNRFDPVRGLDRLLIEPISRAAADQRAGRCGRTSDGVCIRLYDRADLDARPHFTDPEIRRAGLAGVLLRLLDLGLGELETFPFPDPPDTAAADDARATLFELGAIGSPAPAAALTDLGRAMARFHLDPRIARMLLAADREGCLRELILLAAALETQDPRLRPAGRHDQADRAQQVFHHPSSDFLTLLNIFEQHRHQLDTTSPADAADWCRAHFLSPARMRDWAELTVQLARTAADLGLALNPAPAPDDAVHRALLTGLISNVACRQGDGSFDYRAARGKTVQIFPGSALFKKSPRWIMAAEIVQTSRVYARTLARVEPEWIEQLAGHMLTRQHTDPHFDPDAARPAVWERATFAGMVIVPRRRVPLAHIDPAAARRLLIREGLITRRTLFNSSDNAPPPPFIAANSAAFAQADLAAAKLRSAAVLTAPDDLARWFERRLPPDIADPDDLFRWSRARPPSDPHPLELTLDDLITPDARAALARGGFPDQVHLPPSSPADEPLTIPVTYALAPGDPGDGVTFTAPLHALDQALIDRAQWLVPGMLEDLLAAHLRALRKPQRQALEARLSVDAAARDCAAALDFASGPLTLALSEALDALHAVAIPPADWLPAALPTHLRPRLLIIDDAGAPLAHDRGGDALLARLAPAAQRARASRARRAVERAGLTTFDFGPLPDLPTNPDPHDTSRVPALLDRGDSVTLTELPQHAALVHTPRGLRRLFALACREEAILHLQALPNWHELTRLYAQLGGPALLAEELTALIAERTFLAAPGRGGLRPVATADEFQQRLQDHWGRLAAHTREVAAVVSAMLTPRAKVAQRLAGGTPRLWARSIADMREHAAYLMPRGFLLDVPWERLAHFPRYTEAMRYRLFALREDGARAEAQALDLIEPYWKRFTARVAAEMSRARDPREPDDPAPRPHATAKAPLPSARRAAPNVNLDAAAWAAAPLHLDPPLQRYRWKLEDARLALFAESPAPFKPIERELDDLWRLAEPLGARAS